MRPEVLGPMAVGDSQAATLRHSLTDRQYEFSDETALRARWGFLLPKSTFDPAIDELDSSSWVLDLDAYHGERLFEPATILDQVQLFSDRADLATNST